MGWTQGTIRVRVPATSANLGPGFDSLGLALTLHDEVEAQICASGLSIEISGEGADLAEAGEEHLVVRAMRAAFAALGQQPPGIRLRCVNRIPHSRGLGSSAAAIVAGILAARGLAGHGPGAPGCGVPGAPAAAAAPLDEAAFGLAVGLEGHPDNVAACLGGGLTIAWTSAGHPRMVRVEPLASVTPVVCVAPAPVRTDLARGLLPDMVPHRDAAANAGRSALLVAALCFPGGDAPPQTPPARGGTARPPVLPWPPFGGTTPPDPPVTGDESSEAPFAGALSRLLLDATEDWLHQEYRATVMPETYALVRQLRAAGLPAVVSGAGPSVLAFLGARGGPDYRRHLDSLGSIARETGIAWHISSLDVERRGARVLRPEPPPGC
jgi:homoserine kinase